MTDLFGKMTGSPTIEERIVWSNDGLDSFFSFKMMDVSRHKSMDTLRGYVRDAELFRDHAGSGLL